MGVNPQSGHSDQIKLNVHAMLTLCLVARTCNFIPFAHFSTAISTTDINPHPDSLHNSVVKPKNSGQHFKYVLL